MKQQFRCCLSMLLVATLLSSAPIALGAPPPYQWWLDMSFINAMNRNIKKFSGDYKGSYFEGNALLSRQVIQGIAAAPYYPDDIADGYQLYQGFSPGGALDRSVVIQNKVHHVIAVGLLHYACHSVMRCNHYPTATLFFHKNNHLAEELKKKIVRTFNLWAASQDY